MSLKLTYLKFVCEHLLKRYFFANRFILLLVGFIVFLQKINLIQPFEYNAVVFGIVYFMMLVILLYVEMRKYLKLNRSWILELPMRYQEIYLSHKIVVGLIFVVSSLSSALFFYLLQLIYPSKIDAFINKDEFWKLFIELFNNFSPRDWDVLILFLSGTYLLFNFVYLNIDSFDGQKKSYKKNELGFWAGLSNKKNEYGFWIGVFIGLLVISKFKMPSFLILSLMSFFGCAGAYLAPREYLLDRRVAPKKIFGGFSIFFIVLSLKTYLVSYNLLNDQKIGPEEKVALASHLGLLSPKLNTNILVEILAKNIRFDVDDLELFSEKLNQDQLYDVLSQHQFSKNLYFLKEMTKNWEPLDDKRYPMRTLLEKPLGYDQVEYIFSLYRPDRWELYKVQEVLVDLDQKKIAQHTNGLFCFLSRRSYSDEEIAFLIQHKSPSVQLLGLYLARYYPSENILQTILKKFPQYELSQKSAALLSITVITGKNVGPGDLLNLEKVGNYKARICGDLEDFLKEQKEKFNEEKFTLCSRVFYREDFEKKKPDAYLIDFRIEDEISIRNPRVAFQDFRYHFE